METNKKIEETAFTFFPNLNELIGEIDDDTIVSRTVYRDEQLRAILFGFAAQQELSEHTAARPAIIYFLKGRTEVTIGESTFEAEAGSWLHMPAHLPHSIVALEPAEMLLLLV